MRTLADPQQNPLFDPFQGVIPPLGLKRIRDGWQGFFRHTLLHLLPAHELGKHFHPTEGRPTKDLYSVAGLIFLQEANDWTDDQAVEAYLFRTDVQYALNLEPGVDQMCLRTLERYRSLFIEDDLAAIVMERITGELVEALQLRTDEQRLDSTHIYSNMASFGRTRLMGVSIKRFLTQVRRHHSEEFSALPEELRQRYAVSTGKLFGGEGKSPADRARGRQKVAEEMHDLVVRFADHPGIAARSSYKAMAKVFEQQCTVVEDKVEVRTKTGGACLQNPSDLDATYDGHKGQGYKAQLAETCSPDNGVQLILAVLPQTAAESDADAVVPILDELQRKGCLPDSMLADQIYGGDTNHQAAAVAGVELISPVAGRPADAPAPTPASGTPPTATPEDEALAATPADEAPAATPTATPLAIDDFEIDARTGQATACPSGAIPLRTIDVPATGKTTIEMSAEDCDSCPHRPACPIGAKAGKKPILTYTDKQRRLAERRRAQETDEFRRRYAKRSGIESTNSGLKRRLGLGELRVRGMKAVSHAVYLKVAAWNLLRAVASGRLAGRSGSVLGLSGAFGVLWTLFWLNGSRNADRSARIAESR